MTEGGLNPRHSGAGRWVGGIESLTPPDAALTSTVSDDGVERTREFAAIAESNASLIGVKLRSMSDKIADGIAGVEHDQEDP